MKINIVDTVKAHFPIIFFLYIAFLTTPDFTREKKGDGVEYASCNRPDVHSLLVKGPFAAFFILGAPLWIFFMMAPAMLNDTLSTESRVVSLIMVIFALSILGGFLICLCLGNKDLKKDRGMLDFKTIFTVSRDCIELRNTPDAQMVQVEDIVKITIRNQDIPTHHEIPGKKYSRGAMRLKNYIYSSNFVEFSLYGHFEYLFIFPSTYNVDIETEALVLTLARGLRRSKARKLAHHIGRDAGMKLIQAPNNRVVYEFLYDTRRKAKNRS
jgi:hypothetical protein